MLSKAFTSAFVVLALTIGSNAHAGVEPALGVKGKLTRNQVQRPNAQNPCGNVNIAQALGSSTPISVAADGSFTATVTDFNAGADGSRSVSGTVDASASGKSFTGQLQVTKNGDPAPKATGSDQITASLPAGTKCTGGASGNLCLVSFKTTAGFGNCVVVQQGGAANGAAGNNAAAGAAAAGNAGAAAGNGAANAGKKGNRKGKGRKGKNAAAAGTRAARALLARGEEAVNVSKRGVFSWIWA